MNKAYSISANTSNLRLNRWIEMPMAEFSDAHLFFLGKRLFDLILALTFIFCFLPFYLLLAIFTFASSSGPVIYSQERVGKNGKRFTMYKFRSMEPDAESHVPLLAVPNDPRITKWGRFMRRYKLDETPQFFNVLQGSMSVVGPRPERAFFKDKLKEIYPFSDEFNQVKPGITSLGQIKFGYASNLEQMHKRARFDALYLKNLSLWTDVKIIALTVAHVFVGERSKARMEA